MKTIVTIVIISLVMIIRQGLTLLPPTLRSNTNEVLEQVNLIHAAPGPGWIEESDYSQLKVIAPGIQVDPEKEKSLCPAILQGHFRSPLHYHPNPLLIDRPPPFTMQELT